MVGGEGGGADGRLEPGAAVRAHRERAPDQGLGGHIAEEDQRGGRDQVQFRAQDLEPLLDLPGARRAVLEAPEALDRRAHLDDVRHVDLRPVDRRVLEQPVQELAGPPHERALRRGLLLAGRLPDDHEPRVERPLAEDHLRPEPLARLPLERVPRRLLLHRAPLSAGFRPFPPPPAHGTCQSEKRGAKSVERGATAGTGGVNRGIGPSIGPALHDSRTPGATMAATRAGLPRCMTESVCRTTPLWCMSEIGRARIDRRAGLRER